MAKQESKSKRFHKKLFSSYRMVIINEETFEEKAQLRISRFRVIVTGVLFLSLFCLTAFFTISYTPLKEYIPGYDSSELRQKAIQNLFTTDSLIILYNQNLQYLDALRGVISEDVTTQDEAFSEDRRVDTSEPNSSFTPTVLEDSLLRAFVANEDKYNPKTNSGSIELSTLLLPPAKGPISQGFDLEESHFAIDIVLEENRNFCRMDCTNRFCNYY
jgi:hypothetical protein